MRIEMCGPPTAGKSKLVQAIKKLSVKRGSPGKIEKIPEQWIDFANFIRTVYKDTTYQTLPDKTLKALAAAWQGDQYKGLLVYDELTILCGFSMAIRMSKKQTSYYFKNVPLPGVLVNLTANISVLEKRNIARGEKNRIEKTKRCIEMHNKYLSFLRKRKCRILTFDTGKESSAEIAAQVLEKAKVWNKKK